MSELNPHLDDFVLLRYTAGELGEPERQAAGWHLEDCSDCSQVLAEVRRLDSELQLLAADAAAFADPEGIELAPGDPFAKRPEIRSPERDRSYRPERLIESALEASRKGQVGRDRLLEIVTDPRRSGTALDELLLSDAADRFALLYALQEAGYRIAEGPARMWRFAEDTLQRLRRRSAGELASDGKLAERMVPRVVLLGQAHVLAGQGCNWMSEYEGAKTHFQLAYASFGRVGDEASLALVEQLEAQRRYFIGRGEEALVLSRRAAATFEALGLDDSRARARGSEGMALFLLGRAEESLAAHRSTLPIFKARSLWTNYVVALNNTAVSLVKLGRLDEARREYARALRRLSREKHPSILAFIRHGLAEVLFAAARYREAAQSLVHARRLYDQEGLRANALTAWLFEVESWARSGDLARARVVLSAFSRSLSADRSLDPSVSGQIEKALSGLDQDFRNIAELRRQAESILPPSWRGMSA